MAARTLQVGLRLGRLVEAVRLIELLRPFSGDERFPELSKAFAIAHEEAEEAAQAYVSAVKDEEEET